MARYRVKARKRTFEVSETSRLIELARQGKLHANDLIKDLPDGLWTLASHHPEVGHLFADAAVRVTPLRRARRGSFKPATPEASAPPMASAPPAESKRHPFWVKTRQSTVFVRDQAMLERLCAIGILKNTDGLSTDRNGPFQVIGEISKYSGLFPERSPSAIDEVDDLTALLEDDEVDDLTALLEDDEVDDLTALLEDEADSASATRPQPEMIISQDVIELNSAEIELWDEAEEPTKVGPPPTPTPRVRLAKRASDGESEVIALDPSDLEALNPGGVVCKPTWSTFREAMNEASTRLLRETPLQPEHTWDLFRAMMERSRPGGPSENTWNHFRARIQRRHHEISQRQSVEDNWDRFRALMMQDPLQASSASTWERFVHSIRSQGSAVAHTRGASAGRARGNRRWPMERLKVGRAIVGEARVKSVVVRRSDIRPMSSTISIGGMQAVQRKPTPPKDGS